MNERLPISALDKVVKAQKLEEQASELEKQGCDEGDLEDRIAFALHVDSLRRRALVLRRAAEQEPPDELAAE
jgi:hypothetical protein